MKAPRSNMFFKLPFDTYLPRPTPGWWLPALIFLLIAFASLSPSSFFLHFDASTASHGALNVIRGCWGYTASKPAPMLLLVPIYALGGANPLYETILLSLLGILTVIAMYRLTDRLTVSASWAMLGALWFSSLPIIIYYTRIHIGYPLAFFALGLMLQSERQFGWAGCAFGMAMTSHPNFVVSLAIWLFWSGIFHLFDQECGNSLWERLCKLLKLAVGILGPILLVEGVQFLYTGEIMGWIRGFISEGTRLSISRVGDSWPITFLLQISAFSNGWVNLVLLLIGLLYPFFRKPRVLLMDAVFLAGWSIIGAYSLRVALGNTFLTPRMFAGAYPLLVVSAIFTLMRVVNRLKACHHKFISIASRFAITGMVVLALPVAIIDHTLDAAASSRTGYDKIAQVFFEAAEAGLPVRYFGNWNVGLFYGMRYNVEVSLDENSVEIITGDNRAVLLFESADSSMANELRADSSLDPAAYSITSYLHRTPYRPSAVEGYSLSPQNLARQQHQPYSREPGAHASRLQVWWPIEPQGTFRHRVVKEEYIYYYQGHGCSRPDKPFFDGTTTNYADYLVEKAKLVWDLLSRGEFSQTFDLIRTWISE